MTDRTKEYRRIIRSALRRQWLRRSELLGVIGCFLSGGVGAVVLPPAGIALIGVGLLWGWWLWGRARRKRDWLARRFIRSIAKAQGYDVGNDPDGLGMLVQDLGIAPPGKRETSPLAVKTPSGTQAGDAMAMAGLRVREPGKWYRDFDLAVGDGPIGWILLAGMFLYWCFSNRSKTEYRFDGLIGIVPATRRFGEGVTVLPRRGVFEADDLLHPDGWEEVRLEDPKFTDEFRVYAPDQVESRYLLMPSDMEHIRYLSQQFGHPVAIRYHEEAIYFAVDVEAPVLTLTDADWNEESLLFAAERFESEITYSSELVKSLGSNGK